MRRFLDYPKFRRGATRLLVLATDYFFDQSWLRAAERLGWQARSVHSVMVGEMTRDDAANLFQALGEFQPDFILTSNYAGMDIGGMFARFFEDARIPYVSWFTDTPRMILYGREVHCSHYSVAATWERAYIPHFKALGFDHVYYMPLATDPEIFDGTPAAVFDRDLAFVGTSMIPQVDEAWAKLAQRPDVIKAIHDGIDSGRINRERFADGMETLLDAVLWTSLDSSQRRNAELAVVYEATRRQRADMVRRLLPLGVRVRGDPDWRSVTPMSDGPVGYHTDLAAFYRGTAINLNTTSLQMKWAVNQRVFDCPAAGGFLITDWQADLEELLEPETEVVTYASLDELEEKVRYFLRHPAERMAIARAARRRVHAHHTHVHRLASLEIYLKKRYEE